jgi:hypothetical protein
MSYFTKKAVKYNPNPSKSGPVTAVTKSLDSVPWEIAAKVYEDAANMAGETATLSHKESYEDYIDMLDREWNGSHEAPYEGNWSDSHPITPTPDLKNIKAKAGNLALVAEFVERYGIPDFSFWLMPQITTLLAGLKLTRHPAGHAAEGKISGAAFGKEHFGSSRKMTGLYRFLMLDTRSSYLKQQYKADARCSCALVPLVMYAHKVVHGVPYSAWDKSEIHYIVNPALCAAMLYEPGPMTREEILAERDEGLKVRSGDKEGTIRNATYTHKLTGPQLKTGIFAKTPELAQVMLAQIWCAHPDNRTKYMVLDPVAWDSVPAPLIATALFGPKSLGSSTSQTVPKPRFVAPYVAAPVSDLPWDQ